MKNKCLVLGGIAIAIFLITSLSYYVYARTSSRQGDQVVQQSEAEDMVGSILQMPAISAPTSSIAVDLSDNFNFRHVPSSGQIEISKITTSVESESTATTTIRYGVIASTSPSGALADISWFHHESFAVSRYAKSVFEPTPGVFKLGLSSASTTGFITNDKSSSVTDVATTSKLTSPRGVFTINPAVGDLVMQIYQINGTATVTAETTYRVKE